MNGVFSNPFRAPAPDPFLFWHSGWYYMTYTTGVDIRLCRTRTLSGFKDAETRTIWIPKPVLCNSRAIWAPEIHCLDGRWWAYYAATDGAPENRRMFALSLGGDSLWEGEWSEAGKLAASPDRWAIDGTVLEADGERFFVWSGWEGNVDRAQNLYIANMSSPTRLEGERVLISEPEYDWECLTVPGQDYPTVNEGPAVLYTESYVSIVYSASHFTSSGYCLGMLRMRRGDDPLRPESWEKSKAPLFVGNAGKGVYSPGHNCFFRSPDGAEMWMAYHAFVSPPPFGKNPRCAFAQPFALDENETPSFGEPVAPGQPLPVPSGE